ncbi:MAG: sn-glycerol-3-phosphate ABC transporter ATP-binding protein UgpC [Melioribacteraceae bacterium]|nr:sn-glycerol-3-phosphate ABC transporter ATP-binding protein UgpC [Melioribacteraceae bacterium]MCF8353266.1 sn-glycerol-3-phosphate ABC transporter ATP-binding protein UgpC [Melioribacteraceae bacterium]MCF8394848.1 sn-glycerol-3-phosphate ABC transporter ATP-binding protein UgpC [Melioribacteraceae bacterium]MCF8418793.1 sn-glycerol-3-phosphate ABC transporter ATP-binding protein UgpC [Melioribacteraceae bacterium]
MAQVELRNVSKIYSEEKKVVDNVNFTVEDKEFVVLVGPSGCGKSTTLRMIAGLEEITEGEILIDGEVVNNQPPKDRDIAMVFQNYALYPHMTVYDNMAFGLKLRKYSKDEITTRVAEAAKILGLEEYLHRKPKVLSGGQRQRVAVGRAIVRHPKVFLFDEPLSNLDAKLRVQMRTEISKLHHRLDATMIYVTHDQTEAMTMGNRIVVMNNGLVQQIDSPLHLYNEPVNHFVGGFIGSPAMNFLEGVINNEGALTFSVSEKINIKLPASFSNKLNRFIKNKLILGIRPEHFSLTRINSSEEDFFIEAIIEVIEPLGNETFLYFTIQDKQQVARVDSDANVIIGNKIKLFMNSSRIYFFNENGDRIV